MKGQKVGYVRVSSVEQNTGRQLEGIEVDRIFVDRASGKNTDRPKFQEMLNYVREGDRVIVHSMDRFARSLKDLVTEVDQLVKRGVAIQFVKENITFTAQATPMDNLMLQLMGAFAQFEREIILERQKEGIKIAAATSSDERLFRPCLTHCGIMKYFDAFTVTQEVKRGKGFPDVYQLAAEKLSLKPEQCVVYEDILAGIRGAKMGGFAAVGVYDRSGEGNRAKMEQEADRYVTSFKELMNGGDSFF